VETVEFSRQSLDDLRTLLILGWLILAAWWALVLRAERPDKPTKEWDPDAYCPLGRLPQAECPHCNPEE
jgi:hypothetical protein